MGHGQMVLRVPAAQFAAEVRQRVPDATVYVGRTGDGGARATAADPERGVTVTCLGETVPTLRTTLEAQGITVTEGMWDVPDEPAETPLAPPIYVSAVAYHSADGNVGVWVDVDEVEPFEGEILRRMYDEFIDTGELRDVDYETFLRKGEPTCVIVDPEQVRFFLRQKLTAKPDAVE